MQQEEREELEAKALCRSCVGEPYLSDEIRREGRTRTCSYCGRRRKSYAIGEMADRVEQVFEEHYTRTLDHPNSWQATMLSDRESEYDWERDGEPVTDAIMNSADMPEEAARDIQQLLGDRHDDFESAKIGEETEFSSDSYYEEKGTDDREWQAEWATFERSMKSEARFFSRVAVEHLSSVFAGIDALESRDGRPLVVDAGPGTNLEMLYRARVFQSTERLEEALCRPDQHLGSPPSRLASAGRMNATGISVFYGATDPDVAVAEVRPPVGSRVAVGRFRITRPLRLLDLTALGAVASGGSVYDPDLGRRLSRAMFLRSLSARMTRPVMPDDEAFEYLPTQAVADFLATEATVALDGIIFPSAQAANDARNVVLFHKAARVEAMALPDGTDIKARSGEMYEEGWETEYVVIEETPAAAAEEEAETDEDELGWPVSFDRLLPRPWAEPDADHREAALRVDNDGVTVGHVESVQYSTESYDVRRMRWEKRDLEDL